ncbi:MAG TPA: YdcF family protein [Syntrophobacteria bacterium]|nr:YdcF family protein [Syntrophobacteria bacterium]
MFSVFYLIKYAALPPNLILLLLLVGFFLCLTRRRPSGFVCLGIGILLYGCLSLGTTARYLVGPLESAYRPLGRDRLPQQGTLVVLGGGVSPLEDFPASDRLGRASFRRAVEAVRLYHLMGGPEICVSGGPGNPFSPVAEAPVLRDFLIGVGIPEDKIILETRSRTTFENVEQLLAMPLKRPLIVVTSARHMSRALRVFSAFGETPIPAPCDFHPLGRPGDPLSYLPSAEAFSASTSALYEYLGIAWYRLLGRIGHEAA